MVTVSSTLSSAETEANDLLLLLVSESLILGDEWMEPVTEPLLLTRTGVEAPDMGVAEEAEADGSLRLAREVDLDSSFSAAVMLFTSVKDW